MKSLTILLISIMAGFSQNYVPIYVPPSSGGGTTLSFITAFATLGTARNNFGNPVGGTFIPTANMTVISLGISVHSGGTKSHNLGLWDSSGTLLASASYNATGLSGLNYFPITHVSLTSGSTYYIGYDPNGSGDDMWCDSDGTYSYSADFSSISASYQQFTVWPSYPNTQVAGSVFGPVTFQYTKP